MFISYLAVFYINSAPIDWLKKEEATRRREINKQVNIMVHSK